MALALLARLPRTHHGRGGGRGGNQEARRRYPGGIQQPRELQKASFSQIITILTPNAKTSPDVLFYEMFLKVRLGFIGIYYRKCSPTAVDVPLHTSRPLDTRP